MKRFNICSNIYYKEEIEAERKFYPRIEALLGAPFREVYRILRSTPYGASPVMYILGGARSSWLDSQSRTALHFYNRIHPH